MHIQLQVDLLELKYGVSEKHTKFEKIVLMVLTNQLIYFISKCQNHEEDFFILCVLLKKSELYLTALFMQNHFACRLSCTIVDNKIQSPMGVILRNATSLKVISQIWSNQVQMLYCEKATNFMLIFQLVLTLATDYGHPLKA